MGLSIFPFANLDIGQCFMYDCAPYMKIGKKTCKGTYTEFEVNAVGLLNGSTVRFAQTDSVRVIDNKWKDVAYEETDPLEIEEP